MTYYSLRSRLKIFCHILPGSVAGAEAICQFPFAEYLHQFRDNQITIHCIIGRDSKNEMQGIKFEFQFISSLILGFNDI